MSELARQIDLYLANSVAAYASGLARFLTYLTPPGLEAPEPLAHV